MVMAAVLVCVTGVWRTRIRQVKHQVHFGMDQRARVMMTVKGGKWILVRD